jgi:cytochrome c biogenesis protein CcdA
MSKPALRWALTLIGVTVAALGGFAGFRWAATLDLGGQAGAGLVALAAVTGFAVFFSPCSFPLLVTMLAGPTTSAARSVGDRDSNDIDRSRVSGIKAALAVGFGAALFLLIAGVFVGLLGDGIARYVGFATSGGRLLRGAVAVLLVVFGLVQLGVVRLPLARFARFAGPLERRRVAVAESHPRAGQVLYGMGFVVAGFG